MQRKSSSEPCWQLYSAVEGIRAPFDAACLPSRHPMQRRQVMCPKGVRRRARRLRARYHSLYVGVVGGNCLLVNSACDEPLLLAPDAKFSSSRHRYRHAPMSRGTLDCEFLISADTSSDPHLFCVHEHSPILVGSVCSSPNHLSCGHGPLHHPVLQNSADHHPMHNQRPFFMPHFYPATYAYIPAMYCDFNSIF